MVSPNDVARFHADYDAHTDDRVRLFHALVDTLTPEARVLYPGSYVDIAPSVWFDDVTYVDNDKRFPKFFSHTDDVNELVRTKRSTLGLPERPLKIGSHCVDYRTPLPEPEQSFDVLVSLYAGFISEHCTIYLKVGGTLLVNPSHGDAAMASVDPRYELAGVVISSNGAYRVRTSDLETYLIPKKPQDVTIKSLHANGRGIGYTRSPFAYLFTRVA